MTYLLTSAEHTDAVLMGFDGSTSEDHTALVREAWGGFTIIKDGVTVELSEDEFLAMAKAALGISLTRPFYRREAA